MFHPFDPFSSSSFVGVQFSTVHPVHNLKRSMLNRVGDYCSFYCPEIPVEKEKNKKKKHNRKNSTTYI